MRYISILLVLLLSLPARAQQPEIISRAQSVMQEGEWAQAIRLLTSYLATDDQHLEARYLRGIAYGEQGKHPTLKSRLLHYLSSGETDFDRVLAQDSLYRDVLYQYALLQYYRGDLEAAIQLGEAQLRLKPSLSHVQIGLSHLYWRYILKNDPSKARRWLRQQPGPLARLFVGKTFTLQGLYQSADNIFVALLTSSDTLSPVAVLLARARTHFAWGKAEEGTALVQQAIDAITSQTDALLLFEDIKTILDPRESTYFHQIQTIEDYRQFFVTFWTKRDPMPAAPYNARIAEHYRRLRIAEQHYLFYGFRAWYRSPFTHDLAQFASTYRFSQDFDDRGITFIRHGEPDDYTVGEANSWLYEDSLLIFHFAPNCIRGICSVTTHFSPIPHGQTWHPRLVGLDFFDAERKSSEFILKGLTTDRHRWSESTRVLEFPYVIAAFRGVDHKTLIEVHYGIPFSLPTDVETGLALHDANWRRHGLLRNIIHLEATADSVAMPTGYFQIDLTPMEYQMALHMRSLNTPELGAYTIPYHPPDFEQPGLKMSDILLADNILVLGDRVATRNDLYLQVNPSHRFQAGDPVCIYFEIYDLNHPTTYRIAYTLTPTNRRGEVSEKEEGAITLQTSSQETSASSVVEYIEIDMSDVRRGTYLLTITIQDDQSGTTTWRTRKLEIIR